MDEVKQRRRQGAAEKIAAQRAAERQRRRRLLLAGGSVLVVLVVAVVFIVVRVAGQPASPGSGRATASAGVARQLASVPSSTLNVVGPGTAARMQRVKGQPPLLTSGGKPEVLYVGAEYCPYCAAERWALAVALSRFGTFSGLRFIHSSGTDVYPDTPTLTFYQSRYASRYVAFSPVETTTVSHAPLQSPTKPQLALFTRYDAPPYVPPSDRGAFPYVNIGNRALIIGAQYLPSALSGLTWSQVAAAIRDPSTAIAKDVGGAANMITAELCRLTHGQPGNVCTSPGVRAAGGSG